MSNIQTIIDKTTACRDAFQAQKDAMTTLPASSEHPNCTATFNTAVTKVGYLDACITALNSRITELQQAQTDYATATQAEKDAFDADSAQVVYDYTHGLWKLSDCLGVARPEIEMLAENGDFIVTEDDCEIILD
jgi:hypothetical protein